MNLTKEQVRDKHEEAMASYNRFLVKMIYTENNEAEVISPPHLEWIYRSDYWTCTIENSSTSSSTIVYIPPNGKVPRHYHDDLNEEITIISGEVEYEVYSDKDGHKLLKKGVLTKNTSLNIIKQNAHYVFSCKNKSSLMHIQFYR